MRTNVVETITGAVVIVVAVAFFVFAYQTAGVNSAAGGYEIKARFGQIDGLARGSDVRMSGIKVGSIVDQTLDPETFEAVITMAIDPTIRLPSDTSAVVASEGLLGGRYVQLKPGGAEEMLIEGDTIEYTQGAVDLLSLIGQAVFGESKN